MKIRARKYKYNSEINFEDFKCKEFSLDKESFVPDQSLSCNECGFSEDHAKNLDSHISFLVKLKADNLNDPNIVKDGVCGFELPESFNYRKEVVKSFFKSVRESHFVAILKDDQIEELAKKIYDRSYTRYEFNPVQIDQYLYDNYNHFEWDALYNTVQKSAWQRKLKRIFKEKYKIKWGNLEPKDVKESFRLDPAGYKTYVKEMKKIAGLEDKHENMIEKIIGPF